MENKVVLIDEEALTDKCAKACAHMDDYLTRTTGREPPEAVKDVLSKLCALIVVLVFQEEKEL